MDYEKLKDLLHLEKNPEIFRNTLSPPSCGWGDSFNCLAIEGDKILDNV